LLDCFSTTGLTLATTGTTTWLWLATPVFPPWLLLFCRTGAALQLDSTAVSKTKDRAFRNIFHPFYDFDRRSAPGTENRVALQSIQRKRKDKPPAIKITSPYNHFTILIITGESITCPPRFV
jgi:hypothetical protein